MASGVSIFDKEQKYNYTEPAAECDPVAFAQVVESRRSVRVYNGDPIPESVMRECLRLALLAPNSSNLQTWEFYWVRDPEKKAALVDACLNQPAAKTAAELVVAVSRHDQWRQRNNQMLGLFNPEKIAKRASAYQYHNVVIPLAYDQGFLQWKGFLKRIGMWIRGLQKPTPRSPKSLSDMRVIGHKSVALACENFMLALRSHGFDSCPMEGFDGVRARKILNLPSSAEITMVVSAGRRAENGVYGKTVAFRFPAIYKGDLMNCIGIQVLNSWFWGLSRRLSLNDFQDYFVLNQASVLANNRRSSTKNVAPIAELFPGPPMSQKPRRINTIL